MAQLAMYEWNLVPSLAEPVRHLFSGQQSIGRCRLCRGAGVVWKERRDRRIFCPGHGVRKDHLYPDHGPLDTVDESGWDMDD